MESTQQPRLREPASGGDNAGGAALGHSFGVNETAELVLDLLSRSELLPPDKLALVRGKTSAGASVTQALVEEGATTGEGLARMRAARHHLPLVELASVGVAPDAAQMISLQTLERAVAIPYAFEDSVLRVAVADPGNLHAIDELRLSTQHSLELGVASRDDISAELQRLVRAAEAVGIALEDVEVATAGDEGDDLE